MNRRSATEVTHDGRLLAGTVDGERQLTGIFHLDDRFRTPRSALTAVRVRDSGH
jgi:hypothetical protein